MRGTWVSMLTRPYAYTHTHHLRLLINSDYTGHFSMSSVMKVLFLVHEFSRPVYLQQQMYTLGAISSSVSCARSLGNVLGTEPPTI